MKAKKIHEVQEFTQRGDIYKTLNVGLKSNANKKRIYIQLEKLGVKFWLHYSDFTIEERQQQFIKNINELKEFIDKLVKAGVKYNEIEVTGIASVNIKNIWNVYRSNHVLTNCLTEEDAKKIVDVLNKFAIEDRNYFNYEKNTSSLNGSVYYTDNTKKILDNIIENRKKYND